MAEVRQETMTLSTGRELRYSIRIPENVSDPVPLIMALHYGGKVTPFYGRGVLEALVAPALQDLGAIVVAPDSINGPWTNEINEAAVLELMDYIARQHSIDPDRTLLTGFSLGGAGTWYIGSRNQSRFRALIPIAGRPGERTDLAIPAYVIHSRIDDIVPFEPAEKYVEELQAAGAQAEMHAVDDIPHYETARFVGALRAAVPWVQQVWSQTTDP